MGIAGGQHVRPGRRHIEGQLDEAAELVVRIDIALAGESGVLASMLRDEVPATVMINLPFVQAILGFEHLDAGQRARRQLANLGDLDVVHIAEPAVIERDDADQISPLRQVHHRRVRIESRQRLVLRHGQDRALLSIDPELTRPRIGFDVGVAKGDAVRARPNGVVGDLDESAGLVGRIDHSLT